MDRAARRAAAMGEKKEGGGGGAAAAAEGGAGAAANRALQQCGQLQKLIDISIGSLRGLRTKCAVSNDLTQQEIRTLEAKLVRYICKQRQCKLSVAPGERPSELNSYPRFSDWLYTFNVRPEVVQEILRELTLDALLDMNEAKVKETLRRCGASVEECGRLQYALTCLRKVTGLGGEHKDDSGWSSLDARRESGSGLSTDSLSPASLPWPTGSAQLGRMGSSAQGPRSISVSALPTSDSSTPGPNEGLTDTYMPLHASGRLTPRALHSFITPPTTPQLRRHTKLKPPRTPPPPSRKVFQLLPNFPTLTRSKSHESQLGNRIDEVSPMRFDLPHGSPQMVRRDIGLSVTHRFSTKSWLSQVCHVCQKNMMFGVKCKHCRLKCHNKCTKEAPACRISFLPISRLRRTESVPSDINNPVDRAAEPHFGTLPKALTKKEHPPAMNHLDSSSNPSSTTSSTPSSPAPFPTSSNPSSATTPPNPSPGQRDSRFNFPAAYFIHHRQQFIFPDISAFPQAAPLPDAADSTRLDDQPKADVLEDHEAEAEEPEADKSEAEDDEDEVDDLPSSRRPWRGPISRKASQTSVYLQEWDIPFEQVELGEPIGQGRWGRVHRGRWHGEVAIRLLEMDGHNQDHLKLFKKEVMNYRQTRHENVVLFMGACMNPPHLAIITSFCKGRTLHSFVRDPKTSLDINKTRQIAQEIIKGMGYLHAKGIVHKDLKSKNVFYDNGKVVITDFGLFGISGVVREGRRENQLKLSHDWLCYLAPEVVREMTPGKDEDHLPFSKAADVYAFGTVWYELQARDWPLKNQAAEALIWQIGSGEGMKRVLASISLGKEVTEILSACWAFDLQERPSFTLLMEMLEKLPKLNRRLSHPGHFWKSADRWRSRYYGKGRYGHADFKNSCPVLEEYINSSKVVPRFERFGLGVLESSNPKM
ncbi:PREDICTED: kinase suppressor of Ras 1 isoform X1 [Hipposideros armiger]|uniref:non-specific serine/threonine protein kinase n=3 Tax=Hipposideros armiger TaxID=186990 RepID=A0A8B7RTS8_HIPAR|nr:PREDICTED: kinase suppressor of Ras 1 isoform X1 [Hipposideros armiger]